MLCVSVPCEAVPKPPYLHLTPVVHLETDQWSLSLSGLKLALQAEL